MNRRFRASYKIAIGFAALALLSVYGYRFANDLMLGREHFEPLAPRDVNLVGLDTSAGYGIIIENRAAKLVFAGKEAFGPGKMDESSLEDSGGDKKFVPIKDMLKGLSGDVAGLSYFVERLNDIKDSENSPDAPVWKVEDLRKALTGDKALEKKLTSDLNVNLDGSPLDRVNMRAVQNGILVDYPVSLKISKGPIVARVKKAYSPILCKNVLRNLAGKFYDKQKVATEYTALAEQINSGAEPKEDVKGKLMSIGQDGQRLAALPQQILDSITTVVNDDQIMEASYAPVTTNKGTYYTVRIGLNDEGTKRLYQFSRDRVGNQLLVTVNGVAIDAPFIDHPINGGEVMITRVQDESLAQDLVETIKNKRAKTTK